MNMKNQTTLRFTDACPQEQLAYAWAVASAHHMRSPLVSERLLARCRNSAYLLSTPEALQLLSEVPALSA
jgi:hypothetical protein